LATPGTLGAIVVFENQITFMKNNRILKIFNIIIIEPEDGLETNANEINVSGHGRNSEINKIASDDVSIFCDRLPPRERREGPKS
jgi:hypothetical protein